MVESQYILYYERVTLPVWHAKCKCLSKMIKRGFHRAFNALFAWIAPGDTKLEPLHKISRLCQYWAFAEIVKTIFGHYFCSG